MKTAFTPFSILAGVLAGQISKRLFEFIWSRFSDEDAPDGKYRYIPYGQLAVALLVEGATKQLVKGFVDHGARQAFARNTGEWPGPERPEDEDD